jgi:hypothetical protein
MEKRLKAGVRLFILKDKERRIRMPHLRAINSPCLGRILPKNCGRPRRELRMRSVMNRQFGASRYLVTSQFLCTFVLSRSTTRLDGSNPKGSSRAIQ